MPGIAEFKIVVHDGPTIEVEHTPVKGDRQSLDPRPLKLNRVHRRTTEFLIQLLREGRLKTEQEHEVLGESLFATLFYNEDRVELNPFGNKLSEVMRAASAESTADEDLLRITLEFKESTPELSSWPWEYLFSPERKEDGESNFFIAKRTRMVLTRYLGLTNVRPATPVQPPLKVLLVAPSSDELPVESSSVLEELDRLDKSGKIKLRCLPVPGTANGRRASVTFREFTGVLASADPHVVHFIGHGRHVTHGDRAVGELAFTDEDGKEAKWVSDQQLANEIADNARSLHLVFFQACESAETTTTTSYQTIAGVAQRVFQKSVPAVVAMHYRVLGAIGNSLSREFYANLAERRSILLALNHARREVGLETADHQMWAAFGLPVLYLRGDGVIMDSKVSLAVGSDRPMASARLECPWDGEVEVGPNQDKCPRCERLLVCPACEAPRTWKSDKCSNCEQRVYDDAQGSPLLIPSRYEVGRAESGGEVRLGAVGREDDPSPGSPS